MWSFTFMPTLYITGRHTPVAVTSRTSSLSDVISCRHCSMLSTYTHTHTQTQTDRQTDTHTCTHTRIPTKQTKHGATAIVGWTDQGRSDGGIYRYIYTPKISLPYKFLCGYWLFFSLWPRTNSIVPECVLARVSFTYLHLSLIHIWRCRRSYACRSRWSPYH